MTVSLDPTQTSFVAQYLGVHLEPRNDASRSAATAASWQAAKDAVDGQLRALSDRLRKSAIPEVVGVADQVETLLEPVRVKMLVALKNYDAAPDDEKPRSDARAAMTEAEAWLSADDRVRAVDTNPWGVPVSVAATLGGVLDRIHREIGG